MQDKITQVPMEVKQLSDDGEFVGIASVYGNVDLGGDIVEPGAFTKTIAERGDRVRLMDNHKTRIGIATITDTPVGLEAKGKINTEKQSGRDALSDLKFYRDNGLPMGMSIGYQTLQFDRNSKGNKLLKELKLYEVTVTEMPMNELAHVVSVKSITDLISKARDSREKKDAFNTELAECELQSSLYLMVKALSDSLEPLLFAGELKLDQRLVTGEACIKTFSEAFMAYLPVYFGYMTDEHGGLKSADEFKIGRMFSAANTNTLSGARDQSKSLYDTLHTLLGAVADPEEDDGDTPKSEAVPEQKAEPASHSEVTDITPLRGALKWN